MPADPLDWAEADLKAAIIKLARLYRGARRTEQQRERFERLRHEAGIALIGARDVDERPNDNRHFAELDRQRVLEHLHSTLAAVESLRKDLAPETRR